MVNKAIPEIVQSEQAHETLAVGTEPAADHEVSQPAVRFASNEEVERASEKVFRLHARLLAELAK